MATKGTEVFQLDEKLRVMAETLHSAGAISSSSRRALTDYLGLDYNRLKAAWNTGRASSELNKVIAIGVGFEVDDPTWIDLSTSPSQRRDIDPSNHSRRDSARSFESMLRKRLGVDGAPSAGLQDERPTLLDDNLAILSAEGSGQAIEHGQPLPLFVTLALYAGHHDNGLIFGFRKVRFKLRFSSSSKARMTNRLAAGGKIDLGGARLTVVGGAHDAHWFIEVESGFLEGEYRTSEEPLCDLIGYEFEESFEAEMSVRMLDGSLVNSDGAPLLGANKRAIVERLYEKSLGAPTDSQGWIALGLQRLSVVRRDIPG